MQINDFLYVSLILEILYHSSTKRSYLMTLCKKTYPNLARTCQNKIYENKIRLNWLNLLKIFFYGTTDREGGGQKSPRECQRGLIQ